MQVEWFAIRESKSQLIQLVSVLTMRRYPFPNRCKICIWHTHTQSLGLHFLHFWKSMIVFSIKLSCCRNQSFVCKTLKTWYHIHYLNWHSDMLQYIHQFVYNVRVPTVFLKVVSSLVEGIPPAEVKMFYSVKFSGGVLICPLILPTERRK